jgi:tRNA(Arg) A34 adenosine deaminase TadA
MKTYYRYIQRALDVASTSTYRWQLGAVIVNNGNVLSWAPNKFRNSPSINHEHATYHAEMAALRGCLLPG